MIRTSDRRHGDTHPFRITVLDGIIQFRRGQKQSVKLDNEIRSQGSRVIFIIIVDKEKAIIFLFQFKNLDYLPWRTRIIGQGIHFG